jgi:hypothetical protein
MPGVEEPSTHGRSNHVSVVAFVLVTGFTTNTGGITSIVVPSIADENECHKLALKINTPKHGCFEYKMAAPQMDMADAIQDAQQDGIIR